MQFSIGMGRNLRIYEVASHAQLAEKLGFSHISFIDSQNLSRDVYVMMTQAALSTSTIRIGHGVTNPFTRHPSVTANATATINEVSEGRGFIGIGSGMSAVRTMETKASSQLVFRRAVEFFRKYLSGQEAEWNGATMHSEWAGQHVPIYVAAHGPIACKLAGELGDGVIHSGVHPEIVKWMKENVEKGALKAGRDPSAIDIWARTMCYVAESKEAAWPEVASYAASCAMGKYLMLTKNSPEIVELRQRLEQAEPGLLDEFKRVYEGFNIYHHERADASHGQLVTQRVIDFFLLTGTPDDICEQIDKLGPLGVKNISPVDYTIVDKKGMMLEIANTIMPRFRS